MASGIFLSIFIALTLLSAFSYFFLEIRLFIALKKLRAGHSIAKPLPSVSILVLVHNDAETIFEFLETLLTQDYQGEWDIWIADNRSLDETPKILNDYAEKYPQKIHILTVKEQIPHWNSEKRAIQRLIEKSSRDILFFTQSSCKVKPTWISSMIREFEPGIEVVAGHSFLKPELPDSFLLKMIRLEYLVSHIISAAGTAVKTPMIGTSCNFAFRRDFFIQANGFEGISHLSGNDSDLFLQKATQHCPWVTRYCISPESFVQASKPCTLKNVWKQRKAWIANTAYYSKKSKCILGSLISFLFFLILSFIFSWQNNAIFLLFAFIFSLKILGDFLLISRGLHLFNQEKWLKWMIPLELFHTLFITLAMIFGSISRFRKKRRIFKWP